MPRGTFGLSRLFRYGLILKKYDIIISKTHNLFILICVSTRQALENGNFQNKRKESAYIIIKTKNTGGSQANN